MEVTIKNPAERCDCDACGALLEVGNVAVVMPDKAIYCGACAEAVPTFKKQATPAEAQGLVAKLNAMECTKELNAMTPEQLEAAIAEHQRQQRDNLARFNLFGGFDPEPISGRQRHLFDDGTKAATPADWPQDRPSTVSKTWPRPWSKPTPADRRIANQYKPEATPADLF